MNDEKKIYQISQFNDQRYDHWSELMKKLLRAKGLWKLIEVGCEETSAHTTLTEAQRKKMEEAQTQDYKVKHLLFHAISRTVFEQILDRTTSKIVWDSLKRKFGGNARVKKSLLNSLRKEFEVLDLVETESITEYLARFMYVAKKMRSNGKIMDDCKVHGRENLSNFDSEIHIHCTFMSNLVNFDSEIHIHGSFKSPKTPPPCLLMNFRATWWSMSKSLRRP